ncbi:MAG: hypothetical protein ACQKBU_00605 [Verrucomicrobiales bacterium]
MTGHINRLFLKISGTKGSVSFDSELSTETYRICKGKDIDTDTWKTIKPKATPNLHQRFIKSIRTGEPVQPDFNRGAEIQKLLDTCFKSDELQKPIRIR